MSGLRLLSATAMLGRVVARGAGADGLQARRRLEHALGQVDWAPQGLPANAILFVKRMTVVDAPAFAANASRALQLCADGARRPWLHADAAAADAIVFADATEMAACLVRDWLRGVAAERWWWREALRGLGAALWLRREVLARGEVLVPVAMRLIEATGTTSPGGAVLVEWFSRLDNVEAQDASAALERAFALVHVPEIALPADGKPGWRVGGETAGPEEEQSRELEAGDESALHQLITTVPELLGTALNLPQRRLFAQVMALMRSPSWARTPQLARALSRIEFAELLAPNVGEAAADTNAVGKTASSAANQVDFKGMELRRAKRIARRQTRIPGTSADANAQPPPPKLPALNGTEPFGEASWAPARPELTVVGESTPIIAERVVPTLASATVLPMPAREVHTEFGGIFYLLNAALALGLYGDFTMPRAPGIALSPWDWLALVGERWFGPAFARDPVGPLLAALAGRRPSERPGKDFAAPALWAIDPAWLGPWGQVETVSVQATRSRLILRHPAGFILFDVPRNADVRPLMQARHLCAAQHSLRHAVPSHSRPAHARLPRPGRARWLACMLGYLHARLALTLGTEPGDDVPSLVCRHDARITTGAGEVDVALQLADLPLAIRIAGLDRDPGWIPAAGRAITFQFV